MSAILLRAFDQARAHYARQREPFWALASQILTSGANFLTTVIIIHGSNLTEFGKFSFCFFVIMITRKFLIGAVLLPMSSIMPQIPEDQGDEYRTFLFVFTALFSISSGLLLFLALPFAKTLLDAPWLPDYILPFLAANALANFADFIRRLHLDSRQPVSSFMVDASRFSVQLVSMVLAAFLFKGEFDGRTALWIMAASSLVGTTTGMLGIGHLAAKWANFGKFWERHRSFTGWMGLSTLLEVIQNSVPLFIAMAILGEAALGTLRALQQFANLLNLPFNALMQVMPSMAARNYARGGLTSMRRVLIRLTGMSVLVIAGLSVLTVLVSSLVIAKGMGIHDRQAIPIFVAFMVLNIVMLIRLPFFVAYTTVGKPHAVTMSNVVGAILSCIGTVALTHAWGPIAVPLMTSAGLAIATLFFIFNREAHHVRATV